MREDVQTEAQEHQAKQNQSQKGADKPSRALLLLLGGMGNAEDVDENTCHESKWVHCSLAADYLDVHRKTKAALINVAVPGDVEDAEPGPAFGAGFFHSDPCSV